MRSTEMHRSQSNFGVAVLSLTDTNFSVFYLCLIYAGLFPRFTLILPLAAMLLAALSWSFVGKEVHACSIGVGLTGSSPSH